MRQRSTKFFVMGIAVPALLIAGFAFPTQAAQVSDPVETNPLEESVTEQTEALILHADPPEERDPGDVVVEGNRLRVEAVFADLSSMKAAAVQLQTLSGAALLFTSNTFLTLTLEATSGAMERVADFAGLSTLTPVVAPMTSTRLQLSEPALTAALTSAATRKASTTAATSTKSRSKKCTRDRIPGDALKAMNVSKVHTKYKLTGKKVKVGIISDSYNRNVNALTTAADDVREGNLPGKGNPCGFTKKVEVLQDLPKSEASTAGDEGRAMAQLVHRIAPGATLSFATGFISESSFADNILRLAKHGADVIVDDIGYFTSPRYQDGVIAQAVNAVTKKGVTYVSAAGNFTITDAKKRNVTSFEAKKFQPTNCPAEVLTALEVTNGQAKCHNFGTSANQDPWFPVSFRLAPSDQNMLLQWAQPVNKVKSTLTLLAFDSKKKLLPKRQQVSGLGSKQQVPFEISAWSGLSSKVKQGLSFVVVEIGSASKRHSPRFNFLFLPSHGKIKDAPRARPGRNVSIGESIFGQSAANSAISVAAAPYQTPKKPEKYSSWGPTRILFKPVKSNGKPAGAYSKAKVRAKPDIMAVDGTRTSFFGDVTPKGWYAFYGTSAAAPNVAGVAALLHEHSPKLSNKRIKKFLLSSARKVKAPKAQVGKGLVNAYGAVQAIRKFEKPSKPRSVKVKAVNQKAKTGKLRIKLRKPKHSRAASKVQYRSVCKAPGGKTRKANSTKRSFYVAKLTRGKTYQCTVQAKNSSGVSAKVKTKRVKIR